MEDTVRLNEEEEALLRSALDDIARASVAQAWQREAAPSRGVAKSTPGRRRVLLATAAAGVMLIGGTSAWMVVSHESTDARPQQAASAQHHSTAPGAVEQGQSLTEWIACSKTIAVGHVTEVAHIAPGRVKISLKVNDWIQPSSGPEHITIADMDPRKAGLRPPWKRGGPVLVVIPANRAQPVAAFWGKELTRYRSWITSALPRATTATCPPAFAGGSG